MSEMKDPDNTLHSNALSSGTLSSGTLSSGTSGPDDAASKRIAGYDLGQEIGRGTLSVVYEAQDTRTGQDMALKLLTLPSALTPEEAGGLIAGFEREAQAAARLSHPNLVRIHEAGIEQGRPFLVMERLAGQTLRKRLSAGTLKPAEAFPVLMQIAAALDALHQAGMTHRDVKPTSVMLLPDGTATLLHFGLAQSSESLASKETGSEGPGSEGPGSEGPGSEGPGSEGPASPRRGILVGSPFYLAPEQIKGEESAAADIWALGVLSCEMLTGRLPFTGSNAGAVMYQVVHQPPAPMPELPLAAQNVLRRALDKDPARRHAAASDFVQALMLAYPAKQAAVTPERKPAAPEPKLVAPEPKFITPERKFVMPDRKPAASSRPPLPRWLPVASLLFLFLAGTGGMMLVRPLLHPAHKAADGSAPARSSGHAAETPMPAASPASASAAASASFQAQATPLSHPAAPPSVLAAPRTLPLAAKPVKIAARGQAAPVKPLKKAAVPVRPVAIAPLPVALVPAVPVTASVPVQPRRPAAALHPVVSASPARQPRLASAPARRVIVRVDSYPAQRPAAASLVSAEKPNPAQAGQSQSVRQASGSQTVTLPADSEDDSSLEADARLRKSAWAQTGSAAATGEAQNGEAKK